MKLNLNQLQRFSVLEMSDINRFGNDKTLVTQAKLQRRPNHTELRSMNSYSQIFSRFQK